MSVRLMNIGRSRNLKKEGGLNSNYQDYIFHMIKWGWVLDPAYMSLKPKVVHPHRSCQNLSKQGKCMIRIWRTNFYLLMAGICYDRWLSIIFQMYEHILEKIRQVVWIYGNVTCAGYPLTDIDTIAESGEINRNSVLNLVVYGVRTSTNTGIVRE